MPGSADFKTNLLAKFLSLRLHSLLNPGRLLREKMKEELEETPKGGGDLNFQCWNSVGPWGPLRSHPLSTHLQGPLTCQPLPFTHGDFRIRLTVSLSLPSQPQRQSDHILVPQSFYILVDIFSSVPSYLPTPGLSLPLPKTLTSLKCFQN